MKREPEPEPEAEVTPAKPALLPASSVRHLMKQALGDEGAPSDDTVSIVQASAAAALPP